MDRDREKAGGVRNDDDDCDEAVELFQLQAGTREPQHMTITSLVNEA